MESKDIRVDTTIVGKNISVMTLHIPTNIVAWAHGKSYFKTKKEALRLLQENVSEYLSKNRER